MQILGWKNSNIQSALQILVTLASPVTAASAVPPGQVSKSLNIFSPVSTPADSIFQLAMFVLAITAVIFLTVGFLLVYSAVKFRKRADDDGREPPQVYGSNQLELAWTVIPVLIVVALFLTTARFIAAVQNAVPPAGAIGVIALGHQYWWEYRFPDLQVVAANE